MVVLNFPARKIYVKTPKAQLSPMAIFNIFSIISIQVAVNKLAFLLFLRVNIVNATDRINFFDFVKTFDAHFLVIQVAICGIGVKIPIISTGQKFMLDSNIAAPLSYSSRAGHRVRVHCALIICRGACQVLCSQGESQAE
eukprot:TRINITY_DN1815_c0_g1_i1.p3 TRINITY_DN1815_c0_g1~~TRINITY_DN1815_c0_g1_i1.p3  ORF type:complete len:140 (-),score=0.34 TRINITY_DN1815_c0_g1_i1:47-466(-)